jgi:hypothetical protein
MTTPLACDNCGREGWRYRRGLYGPCAPAADLRAVLDNGDGGIRPELLPFFEGFRAMSNDEQTSRVASECGNPWSRYAPVDEHDRASPQ